MLRATVDTEVDGSVVTAADLLSRVDLPEDVREEIRHHITELELAEREHAERMAVKYSHRHLACLQ